MNRVGRRHGGDGEKCREHAPGVRFVVVAAGKNAGSMPKHHSPSLPPERGTCRGAMVLKMEIASLRSKTHQDVTVFECLRLR